jgi:hypothetical protein
MEVKPHEHIVVKVDGSQRLTLRNRRFVQKLDPRKTRLEDHQPIYGDTTAPKLRPGRMRQPTVTPLTRTFYNRTACLFSTHAAWTG